MTKDNPQLLIRPLKPEDAENFAAAFANQGWHKPVEQFSAYFVEQQQNRRQVFVAEMAGQPAGYVCLLPTSPGGPYQGLEIPCINDFNVLIDFQGRGIGSMLMDAAEEAAFSTCGQVCLGVGMHSGYGSAQRMYVKRGYVPDGTGLWYQDRPLPKDAACHNDDDLVLYMMKEKALD